MPAASNNYSAVGMSEKPFRSNDFADGISDGETLVSATCTISVLSGTDPTPNARLVNGPSIDGSIVTVQVGTMLDGVTYLLLIVVTTSLGQVLSDTIEQPCAGP